MSQGQLSRIRSQSVPAATQARSVSTGNRVPANTGVPPMTSGFDVTQGGCISSIFFSKAVHVRGHHGFPQHKRSKPTRYTHKRRCVRLHEPKTARQVAKLTHRYVDSLENDFGSGHWLCALGRALADDSEFAASLRE